VTVVIGLLKWVGAGAAFAALVWLYRAAKRTLNRYQLLPLHPFRDGLRPPLVRLSDAAPILSEKNRRRMDYHTSHDTTAISRVSL
jgi:hypothetical protein